MDERSWLTERFEANRPRLRGVAYRMLGSLTEAEDAVQEAWLRLNGVDAATIEAAGLSPGDRAEQVPVAGFVRLANLACDAPPAG